MAIGISLLLMSPVSQAGIFSIQIGYTDYGHHPVNHGYRLYYRQPNYISYYTRHYYPRYYFPHTSYRSYDYGYKYRHHDKHRVGHDRHRDSSHHARDHRNPSAFNNFHRH